MPTRKKPTSKARPKVSRAAKTTESTTKAKPKQTTRAAKPAPRKKSATNLGGNIGPLGWIIAAALVGLIGWSVSHNGIFGGANASTNDNELSHVKLYPSVGNTVTGGTLALSAEADDGNNRAIPGGVDYTWTVIPHGGVSGTIISNGHQATFKANDQAGVVGVMVKASTGRQSVSTAINVLINQTPGIDRVSIAPIVGQVTLGKTTQMTPLSYDSNGKPLTSGVTYTWQLLNPSNNTTASIVGTNHAGVVTVNGGGKEGVFNLLVSATYQGKTVKSGAQVLVSPPIHLASVRIYPLIGVVKPGGQIILTASAADNDNKDVTSMATYKWSLLTGGGDGNTLISSGNTAKLNAGKTKGLVRVQVQATQNGVTVSQVTQVVIQ